ncbi:MAG: hypothetical protein ACOC16_02740 [Nanoarchaeota archaeon]
MNSTQKSQTSLEFLLIFGISFLIILIMGGIFFSYFNTEKKTLDNQHLQKIGNEMINYVEKVYFLTQGNRLSINTRFPDGIKNITIHHFNNKSVNGNNISFDYLNITFYHSNQLVHNIFSPKEPYIRFNCTDCFHNPITNVSYFNDTSDFAQGQKTIRFQSQGSWVSVDIIK